MRIPRITRLALKDVGDVIDHRRVGNRFSTLRAVEHRNRNTPNTLPRHAPVRTPLQHVAHAIDAPRRNPFNAFDLFERRRTQRPALRKIVSEITPVATVFIFLNQVAVRLVHGNEPLRRGAKDHRVLAAPAMRIAMVILLTEEQYASFTHKLHNALVRVKHALTSEVLNLRRETASVVDRAIDLQTVALADDEVVMTMTGRCVYAACACLAV